MNKRTFFYGLSLSLVAACAQLSPHEAVQNTNARRVIQNARMRGDHDALSEYFEDAARKMQAKAESDLHSRALHAVQRHGGDQDPGLVE